MPRAISVIDSVAFRLGHNLKIVLVEDHSGLISPEHARRYAVLPQESHEVPNRSERVCRIVFEPTYGITRPSLLRERGTGHIPVEPLEYLVQPLAFLRLKFLSVSEDTGFRDHPREAVGIITTGPNHKADIRRTSPTALRVQEVFAPVGISVPCS